MGRIKRYLFFLVPVLMSLPVMAQPGAKSGWNYPAFREKPYYLGFAFSINQTFYRMQLRQPQPNDSIHNISMEGQPGFGLGLIGVLYLHKNIHLRVMPAMEFQTSKLHYSVLSVNDELRDYSKLLESTWIHFPAHLLVRHRWSNKAFYGLLGAYYAIDIAHNSSLINTGTLSALTVPVSKTDRGATGGAGIDFYLENFKLGMELRYNLGIKNVLKQDETYFTEPIRSLKTGCLVFCLTLEG